MFLKIGTHRIPEEEIEELTITQNNVLITTRSDFFNIRYTKKAEIQDAIDYLKIKDLSKAELYQAVNVLATVCNYYSNRTERCNVCPLMKRTCMLSILPADWREE